MNKKRFVAALLVALMFVGAWGDTTAVSRVSAKEAYSQPAENVEQSTTTDANTDANTDTDANANTDTNTNTDATTTDSDASAVVTDDIDTADQDTTSSDVTGTDTEFIHP